ncbi:hypothetical protein VNO77_38877 [Canavalia gladiata]|uniref:F-box domain-containing protein n=1 Tax=Canavalia gladiata TaxID=3824 RepID=A0AAN9PVB5_CANGL
MENVSGNRQRRMQGKEVAGRRNKKEHMIENKEYISCLPYEVLLHIFSFLPLEALIIASLVSKRWEHMVRNLLSRTPSSLNLDEHEIVSKFISENTNVLQNNYLNSPMSALLQKHFIATRKRQFTQFVDRTLNLHTGCIMKKLCLCFFYDENLLSRNKIDKWFHFALTHGVKELELNFFRESSMEYDNLKKLYDFPDKECVSISLECVKLNFCKLQISNLGGFTSLHSLFLKFVMILNFTIEDLITKCPMLKDLVLERCIIPSDFMICKENIMVKSLTLIRCCTNNWPIWPIDISTPKMSVFTLEELCLTARTIIKAPNLGEFVIVIHNLNTDRVQCETLVKLLRRLSHCHTLSLNTWCIQVLSYGAYFLPHLPILFNNLKHLNLHLDLKKQELPGVAYILNCCHYMESLTLDFFESAEIQWGDLEGEIPILFDFEKDQFWPSQTSPFYCLQYYLKEVNVYGISGRSCQLKMLQFLLGNAKVLEDMSIWISGDILGNLILIYLTTYQKASPRAIISLKM